jgi:head-tail adaptor
MPTYRMTIERTVRFQLDLEADSRLHALRMVNDKALMYDDRDLKETRVIAIKELQKDNVFDPLDRG